MIFNFLVNERAADLVLHYNNSNSEDRRLIDGILAPAFTPGAIELFKRKHGKCPLLVNPALANLGRDSLDHSLLFRHLRGGDFLLQPNYTSILDLNDPDLKKYGQATIEQEDDLLLANAIASTSTSNTITIVKDRSLQGNGVGQQSRIAGAELSIANARRAQHDISKSSSASDSFFLVDDAPRALITAGVSAIISTSRMSMKSKDIPIIEYCQREGIPLYLIPDGKGRGFFNH